MLRGPPRSPLFPYTTLFRSDVADGRSWVGSEATAASITGRPRARDAGGSWASVGERASPRTAGNRGGRRLDRKSTRLNSSHSQISYAVFCLKKKKNTIRSEH